jgi:hypothetical protein
MIPDPPDVALSEGGAMTGKNVKVAPELGGVPGMEKGAGLLNLQDVDAGRKGVVEIFQELPWRHFPGGFQMSDLGESMNTGVRSACPLYVDAGSEDLFGSAN